MGAVAKKRKKKTSDVIVIGAGISGLVQAILLAQLGFSVQILDRQPRPETKTSDTPQKMGAWVSALNHVSKGVLDKVGVWQSLCTEGMVAPYGSMIVKKAGFEQSLVLNKEDVMTDDLGAIVCNSALKNRLWEQVAAQQEKIQFTQADCEKVTAEKGEVTAKNGECWQASWVIGADGAHSWVRNQAGLQATQDTLYTQQAKVGIIQHHTWHHAQAQQCFSPQGVVALLPLHSMTESVVVWSMAPEYQQDDPGQVVDALFPHVNRNQQAESTWHTHNIISQQAVRFHKDRVLLVGDSAVSVHPLAGQGLNLGLQCAGRLTKIAQQVIVTGDDLANPFWAAQYQREVYGFCAATRRFILMCEAMMSRQSQGYQGLGAAALWAADNLPWIKKHMIQHALLGLDNTFL